MTGRRLVLYAAVVAAAGLPGVILTAAESVEARTIQINPGGGRPLPRATTGREAGPEDRDATPRGGDESHQLGGPQPSPSAPSGSRSAFLGPGGSSVKRWSAGYQTSGVASWYRRSRGIVGHHAAVPGGRWTGKGWAVALVCSGGRCVRVALADYCQCYQGTPRARVIDLSLSTVVALGLDPRMGLYRVSIRVLSGGPTW